MSFFYELWQQNLKKAYSSPRHKLTEEELNTMAKMKTHSLLGVIMDWVRDGMRDNYMTYFEQMRSILDKEIVPSIESSRRHNK